MQIHFATLKKNASVEAVYNGSKWIKKSSNVKNGFKMENNHSGPKVLAVFQLSSMTSVKLRENPRQTSNFPEKRTKSM